jgi:hypothetical protein
MRLSLTLNGSPRVIAAVSGPGYLSAHLNLCDRPKDNENSKSVRIAGTQTLETETVRFHWPEFELHVGDTVELRLLNDGEGDPPSAVRRSSESPHHLFSNAELAKEMFQMVTEFNSRLMQLLSQSEQREPSEEHRKIERAVGAVLYEHGAHLLYPIFRRHKELIPDELKGELL